MCMKKSLSLLSMLVVMFALGCTPTEKKADIPPPPRVPQQAVPAPEPQAGTAAPASTGQIVQDYGKGLSTSIGKAKGGQEKVNAEAIRIAVQTYYSDHEKYPDSLEDIRGFLKEGTDISIYNYDTATGTVSRK